MTPDSILERARSRDHCDPDAYQRYSQMLRNLARVVRGALCDGNERLEFSVECSAMHILADWLVSGVADQWYGLECGDSIIVAKACQRGSRAVQ